MAEKGASLNTYNIELMASIEELKSKRDELNKIIKQQTAEKAAIQREIEIFSSKLSLINESLTRKLAAKGEYDRIINEIDAIYSKLLGAAQIAVYTVRQGITKIDSKTTNEH